MACFHLALLGWVRVNQPASQSVTVLPAVQVRQIEAAPRHMPQPAPITQSRPERPPVPPKKAVPPQPTPARVPDPVLTTPNGPSWPSPAPPANDAPAPSDKATSAGTTPHPPSSTQATASAKGTTLPSSQADYLSNPPPPYPPLSLRLNEQGKVVVRVLIGKDGLALDGSIAQSSGFDRLDRAALKAVMAWRYVPGTVDGQARDMWFDVPVHFKPPR